MKDRQSPKGRQYPSKVTKYNTGIVRFDASQNAGPTFRDLGRFPAIPHAILVSYDPEFWGQMRIDHLTAIATGVPFTYDPAHLTGYWRETRLYLVRLERLSMTCGPQVVDAHHS